MNSLALQTAPAPLSAPAIDPSTYHLFLGFIGARCRAALIQRYGATDCVHIATGTGTLSVRITRDSAGTEVTAELHTTLQRTTSGTRLLARYKGELAIIRRPSDTHDELHIGDTWFAVPCFHSVNAFIWLRAFAGDYLLPMDAAGAGVRA